MNPRIPKTALVDTGFWYALLDQRDPYNKSATEKAETLFKLRYLLPWPVMYETLCTRFARRPLALRTFELFLKRPNAIHVDDTQYRMTALSLTLSNNNRRAISFVDHVLRMVIDDSTFRVDCLFTFNPNDFRDICLKKRVELISA